MNDLPKTFNFGPTGEGAAATPPSASGDAPRKPRGFNLPTGDAPAAPPAPAVERKPRSLDIPAAAPEPTPAPVERKPKVFAPQGVGEAQHQRRDRDRTITDVLIEKAQGLIRDANNDGSLVKSGQCPDASKGELRGKIDTLLHHTKTENLIAWGSLNLDPLQQASNIQAEIANELRRINATEALAEARDAVMRPITLFDRVTGRKPEHYEMRLSLAKTDLTALMIKAEQQRKSYAPEVRDLHLDAIALIVAHQEWDDPVMMQLGNSRAKTLLQAHQTGTMLLITLMNCVQQCGQFVEQIDGLLTTTIPQWKMANQK